MLTFKEYLSLEELAESKILEASYAGNIGAMEVIKFHQIARPDEKKKFKEHLAAKEHELAWRLIQKVTGTKLQGKGFGND